MNGVPVHQGMVRATLEADLSRAPEPEQSSYPVPQMTKPAETLCTNKHSKAVFE